MRKRLQQQMTAVLPPLPCDAGAPLSALRCTEELFVAIDVPLPLLKKPRMVIDGGAADFDDNFDLGDADRSARKLCVLDIDETLVHSEGVFFAGSTAVPTACGTMYSRLRPHARELVVELQRTFDVAVWSAGRSFYVHAILKTFFPEIKFTFVWSLRNCRRSETALYQSGRTDADGVPLAPVMTQQTVIHKPLSRIAIQFGYALHNIVIVDDTEQTAVDNLHNLVLMPPYLSFATPCDNDNYLLQLRGYLRMLASRCDVSATGSRIGNVDKRDWLTEQQLLYQFDSLADTY